MSQLPCPNCKRSAPRLVARGGVLGCVYCNLPSKGRDALLHQVRWNKNGVRVTEADANRIRTNKLRADGRYRPDTRWSYRGEDD